MSVESKGSLVLPYSSYRFGLYLDFLVGQGVLAEGATRRGNATVMEIGAGWGGFASVLKRKYRGARYVIIDIPSSTVFQKSLLHHLGFKRILSIKQQTTGQSEAHRREIVKQLMCCAEFDVLFLSPDQINLLPDDSIDVVVNFDSMVEMPGNVVATYLQQIPRVSRAFYHINRYVKSRVMQRALAVSMRLGVANSSWYRAYSAPNNLMWKPPGPANTDPSKDIDITKGEPYREELYKYISSK